MKRFMLTALVLIALNAGVTVATVRYLRPAPAACCTCPPGTCQCVNCPEDCCCVRK